MKKTYGVKEFPDKIDITDPCYDRNVWCRINNFRISAGEYECYIETKKTKYGGERVSKIGIVKEPAERFEIIGSIGVDAGLAGFFIDKPDYSESEWAELCYKIGDREFAWMFDEGFFSCSGYGDGEYDVYAGYNNGNITEMYISFL